MTKNLSATSTKAVSWPTRGLTATNVFIIFWIMVAIVPYDFACQHGHDGSLILFAAEYAAC
jgi:hypothetical protein